VRANALLWLSEMERLQGDYSVAWPHAEESRCLFQESADQAGLAKALRQLASIALGERHYGTTRQLLEESLAVQQELRNPHQVAVTLNSLGEVARAQGL
jgi:hypothetical protein